VKVHGRIWGTTIYQKSKNRSAGEIDRYMKMMATSTFTTKGKYPLAENPITEIFQLLAHGDAKNIVS